MLFDDCGTRCNEAATEFDAHGQRADGATLAQSLADGLDVLRSELFERSHQDVERQIGMDSMLIPVSPVQTELATNLEIETYMVTQSADEAGGQNYVVDANWFGNWLGKMRLGDSFHEPALQKRFAQYQDLSPEKRRLEFSDVLVETLPEARHIPLVLYRLFPIAIRIVTAVAFGDHTRANELRKEQHFLLPGIADCDQCLGKPLDNGEQCRTCGNPVWQYKWLTDTE